MVTMLQKNLSVIDGDMESPEWIVRNVVIDMAGYWLGDIADLAEIDDEAMTYRIHVTTEPYANRTYTLSFLRIWQAMNGMARKPITDLDIRKDIQQAVRTAVFDKDGGDIDAEVGYAIIQYAMFGEIPFA